MLEAIEPVAIFPEICPSSDFPRINAMDIDWPTGVPEFKVRIHRPQTNNGEWPETPLPLVVFSHGNGGGRYDCYDELLSAVATRGFIVASIESIGTASSEFRGEQILCASRWLTHTWLEKARLRGDVSFMGHSAGGEGALFAIDLRQKLLDLQGQNSMDTLVLKSVISLAPPDNIPPQPLPDSVTRPPILLLQGATDNDPTHAAIRHFDRLSGDEEHPIAEAGRSLVWVYDLAHFAIGGKEDPLLGCAPGTAKGVAVASAYVTRFLRWRMNGESELRKFFAGPPVGETELEALPPEVLDDTFWTEWGAPRIFRQYAPDQEVLFEERVVLDAFEDGDPSTSTALSPVTANGAVVLTEGPAGGILSEVDHRTGALRVDVNGEGGIRWEISAELRQQLSGASFLSFRVGNWLQIDDPMTCQADDAPIPFTVRLGSGTDSFLSPAGEIPVQDHRTINTWGGLGPEICARTTFMKTVRIPLAPLCAAGLDLAALDFVTFEFLPGTSDILSIDNLEFTRSPYDDPGDCGPPLVCEL